MSHTRCFTTPYKELFGKTVKGTFALKEPPCVDKEEMRLYQKVVTIFSTGSEHSPAHVNEFY
jgi:hypothetical protein